MKNYEKMDVVSGTLGCTHMGTPELDASQSSSVRRPFQVFRQVAWSGKLSRLLEDDQLCF